MERESDMPMEILLEMKTLKRGAAVERDSKLESRRSTRRIQGKSGRYVIGARCGLDGLIGKRERERERKRERERGKEIFFSDRSLFVLFRVEIKKIEINRVVMRVKNIRKIFAPQCFCIGFRIDRLRQGKLNLSSLKIF